RVFTARALAGVTKRGHAPPGHPFFQLWDAYWHAATGQLGADFIDLQRELFLHARTRLEHRKNTRNIRAYSDLLARLAGALDGPGGPALADALFRRYPAALIDEFQDTDPVQFTVFQRAYAGGRGSMFLVGDPKQAIYAFRGGDIYAYLRATATASVATLDTNWRSDTPLVEALALLYRSDSTPFLDRRIPFVNVKAAHPARILGPSGEAAPLQLKMIRWDPSKGTRNITAGWADRKLASLVAADIVRFLRSDARLFRGGDRDDPARWSHPVPSDVAVLVRKNADAARVQEALADLGVNSVVSSEVSVFATREARELAAVLAAVLHPSRDARLRAAVVSDIVGLGGNALAEAVADDATWAAWAACFRDLGGRWTRSGFAAVLRRILVEPLRPGHTPALERLVRLPRGERRVTNLLHLGELLQERAMRHSLSPPAVLAWLDERRSGRGDRADEEQLRLESDAQAVTILTVYKGKGLQYSAVWCPYGHVSFDADRVRPLYHGEPPGEVATIDLDPGSWADSDTPAAAEAAAQERRVLYVSLTRAAQRLTLFWGQLNKADKSALAALLHPPSGIGGMKEPAIMAALQGVAARSGGRIQASWLDESPPPRWAGSSRVEALPISTFAGHVRRSWRRTSYTDLTRTDLPHDDSSDHDEVDEGQPGAGAASPGAATPHDALPCSFGAFPAGARPGSAIHEIFECIDFGDGGPGIEQATRAVLGRFRLAGPHLLADTCASVTRALTTALGGRLGAFSLSQLPSARRLVEVAFTFPVSGRGPSAPVLSRRALASFLRARGRAGLAERVDGLSFGSLRGHLTGVIDLAFEHEGRWYIADYKSNHLGKMLGDYHPGALAAEVARHDYDLQYLLYAVALHRHLALRLRGYAFERHFGGVRYLFLRGMHPLAGPERGVHADDLDSALVCGLDELLRDPAKVTP
ncbi:MAG: UvrD-helicase domain-containing protein, partial [Deltaproteobacteria bacterium]|nr:UvrD-helicase domain-containing protein [Deltaproteobacteria bacterium]